MIIDRKKPRLLLFCTAMFCFSILAIPVFANFGSTGSPDNYRVGDDSNFVVIGIRLSAATLWATAVSLNDYNSTDFTVYKDNWSSCTDAYGVVDVCMYDSSWEDSGWGGLWRCIGTSTGSHPNMACSLSEVLINEWYSSVLQQSVCHELGHAVGLQHSGETLSCMVGFNGNYEWLSEHDRNHINDYY